MKNAGFKQDTLYLIRPDGHVVLATDKQWLRVLKMYEVIGYGFFIMQIQLFYWIALTQNIEVTKDFQLQFIWYY